MSFTLTPIGTIHSPFRERYHAPIQVESNADDEAVIELIEHQNYETALRHLDTFSHIWVIWIFHEATTWKPIIQTPRDGSKRGVFATRSPHRPNPIALSAVELLSIRGRKLTIRGSDMVDGSPVIDIKPYIARYDARVNASAGWTNAIDRVRDVDVRWSETATVQAEFLESSLGYNFRQFVERRLQLNPKPTSSNRIEHVEHHSYCMATRAWRIDYVMNEDGITVTRVRSALQDGASDGGSAGVDREEMRVHEAFLRGLNVVT